MPPTDLSNSVVNQATRAQGLADLSDVEDRRVYRPDEVIEMTGDTEDDPYFRLWAMLRREESPSFKTSWYRDEDFPDSTYASAAATDVATSITLEDYKTIVDGQMIYIPRTGEALRVTATPSSTSVSVTRGMGDTSGAAILAGDMVVLGQIAVPEGSGPVDTYSSEPWLEYNYIETRRHGWKVTRHSELEEKWGGQSKRDYEERKHLKRLKREIETSLLFGVRAETTDGSDKLYLSGGVDNIAKADKSRALYINWDGVAMTRASFDQQVRRYFNQKGSGGSGIALCGDNILTILNGWMQDKLQINEQATEVFGTHVYRYLCTNGEVVNFLPHRMWTHRWNMQDRVWFLDMDRMAIRHVPGGPVDITFMARAKDITSRELAPVAYDYHWNEFWQESGLVIKGTENIAIFEGIHG